MRLEIHHCRFWLFRTFAQVSLGHTVRIGYHLEAQGACLSTCTNTSQHGLFLHFALLCPDLWHMPHTFPCRSWPSGNSSNAFRFFCSSSALSTCTASIWRFSECSSAFRSRGPCDSDWRLTDDKALFIQLPYSHVLDSGVCSVKLSYTFLSKCWLMLNRLGSRPGDRCTVPVLIFSSSASNRSLS